MLANVVALKPAWFSARFRASGLHVESGLSLLYGHGIPSQGQLMVQHGAAMPGPIHVLSLGRTKTEDKHSFP